MSYVSLKAKPRRAGRGFAQSTWRLVAFPLYRIGLAGANACLPFLPVALDGAGYGPALLWGGAQRLSGPFPITGRRRLPCFTAITGSAVRGGNCLSGFPELQPQRRN